jgi:hypothetical protein
VTAVLPRSIGTRSGCGEFGLDLRPLEVPAKKNDRAVDDCRIEAEQESAQRRHGRDAVRIAASLRLSFQYVLHHQTGRIQAALTRDFEETWSSLADAAGMNSPGKSSETERFTLLPVNLRKVRSMAEFRTRPL